jgi:phosphoribosyl-AMP cyclohydrolase / phosphoribosyl-ATP pyrophosphohydrolase
MSIKFDKYNDGLVPCIVQDASTRVVLMLGFMNAEALRLTTDTKLVTFFSRSKQAIWVKGETSGNYLHVVEILFDCDADTVLIKAAPTGPVCHTGSDTCFNESNEHDFLRKLEEIIHHRWLNPSAGSYTSSLFAKGINKIAQKVGEEAIELVIESKDDDQAKFRNEAADLLFHYLVLLQARQTRLQDIVDVLQARDKK